MKVAYDKYKITLILNFIGTMLFLGTSFKGIGEFEVDYDNMTTLS
jgi:hypothetical protein